MKKNTKKWIILFLVLLLIVAGVIAVCVVLNKNDATGTTEKVGTNTDASATTENSEKDNSEAETKENTYYWLITDKKTGITVDSEGWSDAKDYNGVSWAKAPTEDKPYVWCYATDPDGKVVIEPTLWYEFQATDNSTSTTTEVASSEKPSTEDAEEKPGSNTNNAGSGNSGGSNTGNTGSNNTGSTGNNGGNTGNTGSNGNNGGSTTPTYHPQTSTTTEGYEDEWVTVEPYNPTTEQQTTTHVHSFELVVTEEKGEYRNVVVQEGYWKPVIVGYYEKCNGCGMDVSTNMTSEERIAHCLRCTDNGTSSHQEPIYGEEWVEPVTETKWVVTEPSKHYLQCSVCGYIDN